MVSDLARTRTSHSAHETGDIARLSRRRVARHIVRGANVTIATLAALIISLGVERGIDGEWRKVLFSVVVGIGFIVVVWVFRVGASCRLRRTACEIGSFFYISALRATHTDRDQQQFRRAMDMLQKERDNAGVLDNSLVWHEVNESIDTGASAGRAVSALRTNFRYAIRNDSKELPTNVMINAAWPLAVGFGYSAAELLLAPEGTHNANERRGVADRVAAICTKGSGRHVGAGGSQQQGVRVWYLPPANELDRVPYKNRVLRSTDLMAGEMIDIGPLCVPIQQTAHRPESGTHDGDAVLIVHATRAPAHRDAVWRLIESEYEGRRQPQRYVVTCTAGPDGVVVRAGDSLTGHESARPQGQQHSGYDPPECFPEIARAVASEIAAYRELVTGKLLLSVRMSKEVALMVGVYLSKWNIDLSRCAFIAPPESDNSDRLEIWDLELGAPGSSRQLSPAGVTGSSTQVSNRADNAFTLLNATPHDVHLVDVDGRRRLTLPAMEHAVRVHELVEDCDVIDLGHHGSTETVDLHSITYGEVDGLPPPQDGILLVVSRVAAYHARGRNDLVFPLDEVRDDGTIIGCQRFGRFSQLHTPE